VFNHLVAGITRDHCREHLRDYLDEINALYSDRASLEMPKRMDIASLVGGVAGVSRETLPALAFDAPNKTFLGFDADHDDLFTYSYQGVISGMVAGADTETVERRAERTAAAVELFVRDHLRLPMPDTGPVPPGSDWPFLIVEFAFVRSKRMGAGKVDDAGRPTWIDGFVVEVQWTTSENGARQHEETA
jgi:hypothetical protein